MIQGTPVGCSLQFLKVTERGKAGGLGILPLGAFYSHQTSRKQKGSLFIIVFCYFCFCLGCHFICAGKVVCKIINNDKNKGITKNLSCTLGVWVTIITQTENKYTQSMYHSHIHHSQHHTHHRNLAISQFLKYQDSAGYHYQKRVE